MASFTRRFSIYFFVAWQWKRSIATWGSTFSLALANLGIRQFDKCDPAFHAKALLRATRGARNPNLQVVITHAWHVRSQHEFELPLRINGMHRTQFDHARLYLLPLVIWSRVFWPYATLKLTQSTAMEQKRFDLRSCRPHSLTFGFYQLLVISHASHACSQHSFGLPQRMNGIYRRQFDHARLDLLSLVIWSRVFWLSLMWNVRKAYLGTVMEQNRFNLRTLPPALSNL